MPSKSHSTAIFRVIVGCFGLAMLVGTIIMGFPWHDISKLLSFAAFFGLTLGYAFGGDKWGGRLFGTFTGIKVDTESNSNDKPTNK